MTNPSTQSDRRNPTRIAAGVLFLVGLGLAGWGASLHLRIAGQVRAGRCDGCAPWHPLLVVAPLVVGTAFVLIAGYLRSRGGRRDDEIDGV